MNQQRVICFVDGFNLYHAIHRLDIAHLKGLNLWSLASVFIRPKSQILVDVIYFSAYADWLLQSKKRHYQYVKALITSKVSTVMGKFKRRIEIALNASISGVSMRKKKLMLTLHLPC
ncbi:MAG: hypothetical protein H0W50_06875 [Parachlamydiaceae bacterium]|nr:hypothetical protein [Parachlamydiaceae bacterium]